MNQLDIEAALNELLMKAESDLEKVFARRLRTILFSVSEMYRKYEKDGELSFTDLNKHNRFQKEMKMIADALSEDYSHIIKQMQGTFEQQYIAKYLMMAYLINMAMSDDEADGFNLATLALPIKNILLAAIKELALPLLLGSYEEATAQKVGAEIVKGIRGGESYAIIAKRIEKILIAEKGKEAPSSAEIEKMLQNPSAKLVLPKEMEQHRDSMVKWLNAEIAKGLVEGQDGATIAKTLEIQINSKPVKDGTDMGFDIPSLPTIKEALRNPIEFLTLSKIMEQHRNDIVRKINIEIAQGLIAGEGYATIAKRIERQVGFASKKARLVARTEAGRSRSIAAEKVREEASKYAKLTPVWASMLDHRVRMTHRKLDGQEADKDGMFHHKSNKTTAPRLWVGPDSAALSIQCRCVLIMKVNGKLPEYRRERDYMDDKYQQKLADKIDEHMDDGLTYVQALKKAQKEVTPPSRVIPYVTYDEWYRKTVSDVEQRKEYKEFREVLGDNAPNSFAAFQNLKYNNNKEWSLLKDYKKSRENNMISAHTLFDDYLEYKNRIDKELIGIKTRDGTVIKAHSKHFIERVFGTSEDPHTKRSRNGVTLEEISSALRNGTVKINKRTNNSRKYVGDSCEVSVNPETGNLIQVNPISKRGKEK